MADYKGYGKPPPITDEWANKPLSDAPHDSPRDQRGDGMNDYGEPLDEYSSAYDYDSIEDSWGNEPGYPQSWRKSPAHVEVLSRPPLASPRHESVAMAKTIAVVLIDVAYNYGVLVKDRSVGLASATWRKTFGVVFHQKQAGASDG